MKTFFVLPLLITSLILLSVVGCKNGTARKEQAMTEANQANLLNIQPPVQLNWSLERENINKRTSLWNDKNKVSYIYLIDFGKIMAFYIIKGKVSSVNSQITNPEQLVRAHSMTLPSPAEDGSYGTNGDAIFFYTTDGTYVETPLDYVLVDKPLKMSTPPALVREIK